MDIEEGCQCKLAESEGRRGLVDVTGRSMVCPGDHPSTLRFRQSSETFNLGIVRLN